MMTPAARYAAAIEVLDGFIAGAPAEKLLSNWARRNRYAGSKDRAAVRDIVFDCLRNLRSFQWAAGFEGGRGLTLGHMLAHDLENSEFFGAGGYGPPPLSEAENTALAIDKPAMPEAVQHDLPDWLVAPLQQALGDRFSETCKTMQQRAPVDLRVNLRKSSVEKARAALQAEGIVTQPLEHVETALRVQENPRRVAGSQAYRDGWVELQDAGSQSVVAALPLQQNTRVLDFCAGGGGKTLAMAAQVASLRISAFDQSQTRLEPLRERANRAGTPVRLLKNTPTVADGLYDLVLLDVPCSGSGSWRRAPEAKWRLTAEKLEQLQQIQGEILAQAQELVAPDGRLAYVTCSILQVENETAVERFCQNHPGWKPDTSQRFTLGEAGDGFFLALFSRK